MQVVDASVVIEALRLDTVLSLKAIGVMARRSVAPELIDIEVIHALQSLRRRGACGEEDAERAVRALVEMPVVRRSHRPFLARIWELRDNLSAYDAMYVALAEGLQCPLVTADARLAAAPGIRCEVEVIGA